jgi:hypothetical protein
LHYKRFASDGKPKGTEVKAPATGLAAGILLDATVIRALLVPAVVSLFGCWNWWLPRAAREAAARRALVARARRACRGRRERWLIAARAVAPNRAAAFPAATRR